MLTRIVKLTFKPENIHTFEQTFKASKAGILRFKGCTSVTLLQDLNEPNIFFTYSHWDEEADLEAYRNSDFFKKVWAATKMLFADKPEAWSVAAIDAA